MPLPDDLGSGLIDHRWIKIERIDLAANALRQRRGEIAVATAEVKDGHIGLDAELLDNASWIGPKRRPPVAVRHGGCRKYCLGSSSHRYDHSL